MGQDKNTYVDLDDDLVEAPAVAIDTARFRVDEELARGGLGKVNRGFDTHLDREVAIKSLLKDKPAARARFQREMRITARLQHPNIVPVYDGGASSDGTPFLAMRLVHGRSLQAAIEEAGTLIDRLALLPHVIAACNAVAYAHHERIVHRDLKPDNILVGAFGETVVIDWGLAKDLDLADEPTASIGTSFSGGSGASSLTRVGLVMGTPAYMPPEQATGSTIDTRADVYALGAVLYHLLVGERPYDGEPDVLAAVGIGAPRPAEELVSGIPPDLSAVVAKAMHRDPAHRYPDAGSLAAELERFESGRWVSAYDYSPRERLVRWIRTHPLATGLSAVLVLTVLTAMIGLTRANRIANNRAEALATLQAEERILLDRVTLDQASLLAHRDPARSLALLDSLSDDHPMDGAVHTVAATAWSAHPPTPLQLPDGASAHRYGSDTEHLAVAWDEHLRVWGAKGQTIDRVFPDTIQSVITTPHGVFACTSAAVFDLNGWVMPLERDCKSLFPIGDDFGIESNDHALALVRGGKIVELGNPPARRRYHTGHHLWTLMDGELRAHALIPKLPIVARGSLTSGSVYGATYTPDGQHIAILGANPALVLAHLRETRVETLLVEVDMPWLVTGAWLDPEHILVGGAEAEIHLYNTKGALLDTHPLRGRPYQIDLVGDQAAVVTDEGQLLLVRREGDVLSTRELGAPDESLFEVEEAPDGKMLIAGRASLILQTTTPPDGTEVLRLSRNARVENVAGSVYAFGIDGAWRLDDPPVQVASTPTRAMMSCAGTLWSASEKMLRSERGIVEVEADPWIVTCSADQSFAIATLMNDTVMVFDPQTATAIATYPVEGLSRTSSSRFQADEQGLTLYSTGIWRFDSGNSPPRLLHANVEGMTSGIAIDDTVYLGTRKSEIRTIDGRRLARMHGLITAMADVDGQLVASDYYGELLRWTDPAGDPERLTGHRQYIQTLSPHPKGRWVASGGWDNIAWIWDLSTEPATGRPLYGHDHAVLDQAWSTDGTRLYTSDRSGGVRMWKHDLPTEPAALRRRIHEMAAISGAAHPIAQAGRP